MRTRTSTLILYAMALVGVAGPIEAQVPKCRAADATSANIITELKNWITTTNPKRISQRDNIFKVPVVSVSQITLVTDERICARAVQGYAALPGGYTPSSLYVIKMGTKFFAVHDPSDRAGDMTTVHIMDSKFLPIGGWTGA